MLRPAHDAADAYEARAVRGGGDRLDWHNSRRSDGILEALGDRKLAELEKYENEFGANLKKARQDMRGDMEAAETV